MSEIIDGELIESPVNLRKKYHIQIRLEETGPKKPDGKRGRILFENFDATYEQVEFFKSPNTLKAGKSSGKELHVWIDNQLYQNLNDAEVDPNSASEMTGSPELNLPSLTNNDLALASSYLRKIQDDIAYYKSEFIKEKAYWDGQISKLRAEYDTQQTRNNEKLVEELALVEHIHKKSFDNRFTIANRSLQDENEDKGNIVDNIVEGIDKITKNETIMGLLAQFMMKKGITPPG